METTVSPNPRPAPSRSRTLRTIGVGAALGAVLLAAGGIALRVRHTHALAEHVTREGAPSVTLIAPSKGESQQTLVLPSNLEAWYDAPIYARVSGYLKKWYVDIGTHVKARELLAEIETPELDQQLQQAQADLATAVAKQKLAETTAKRWQSMLASTAVSKQEADEKQGDYEAKSAAVAAERANVQRLVALSAFKRIVAPFDGTVTERRTDIGALISSGGAGQALFRVADTHKLRVYVDVPQSRAALIKPGLKAELTLPEAPGKTYPAIVLGSADAIERSSRTLRVQLEADNARGDLIAGSYADTRFALPGTPGVLELPVTALMFRQHGLEVATLTAQNTVALKKVELGRDFGTRVEVVAGIGAEDRVIDNPPDWLREGDTVQPAAAAPERAALAQDGRR